MIDTAAEFYIKKINCIESSAFESMTYDLFQPLLMNLNDTDLIGLGAYHRKTPCGFVLAHCDHAAKSARILSLYVQKEHRNRRLGSTLLQKIQDTIRPLEIDSVNIEYRTDKPTTKSLERILAVQCWFPPETILKIGETHGTPFNSPGFDKLTFPEGFSVFPWIQISEHEKLQVKDLLDNDPRYPAEFSPFTEQASIEPANSLGIRCRGSIVGWIITHRIDPQTIRYTKVFVRLDFMKFGIAAIALNKAIQIQNTILDRLPNSMFAIKQDNEDMKKFADKWLFPHLELVSSVNRCEKRL